MPPPSPPPPPPPPGGGGGPPPPPPPPPGGLPARPATGGLSNRGALLGDIQKGRALKKAVTNDRSAPIVGSTPNSSGPPVGGAPPIPGLGGAPKPPGGLAPPVPGNRARSNSDEGSVASAMSAAPQLGGLFAGGMPKLKKRGGIDTGANADSSYASDPEGSAPKPPGFSAPRPPAAAAPAIPGGRPPLPPPGGSSNLRKTTPMGSKPPPPPIGKKPPPLPTSRKPSSMASVPSTPAPPPPPPPASSAPSAPSAPPAPPPPPPSAAPPRPTSSSPAPRSQPPPPPPAPVLNHTTPSLAAQASIRAAGQVSPSFAPPPPPSSAPPPPSSPSPPPPPPPPPATRSRGSSLRQSMLDPSAFTLSAFSLNGSKSPAPGKTSPAPASGGSKVVINDPRWHFKDEGLFPKPRDFVGGTKRYRAGRGSSVPLDLTVL